MWAERKKDGHVKFCERYEDPMSGKTRRVSVTLEADTSCKKLYVRNWPARPDWKTLPRGTYGSSESGARFVRDDLFSGPGVLDVKTDDLIDPTLMILR